MKIETEIIVNFVNLPSHGQAVSMTKRNLCRQIRYHMEKETQQISKVLIKSPKSIN